MMRKKGSHFERFRNILLGHHMDFIPNTEADSLINTIYTDFHKKGKAERYCVHTKFTPDGDFIHGQVDNGYCDTVYFSVDNDFTTFVEMFEAFAELTKLTIQESAPIVKRYVSFIEGDVTVGFAEIEGEKDKDDEVFLGMFAIKPRYRGLGFGQKYLKYCIDRYGVNRLGVDPKNEVAVHIYKKFGFEVEFEDISLPEFEKTLYMVREESEENE